MLNNGARRTHAHATHGPCRTVCGLSCEAVDVEYLNPERVNCHACNNPTTTTTTTNEEN